MCLSFETKTSIIRTGLPMLVNLIDLYNFSISIDLTQMVNFPTWISDCDSQSPALMDFFFLMLEFVLQWLSLHWKILIILLSQFPLTFHHTHNGVTHFTALLMTILMLIGMVCDHLSDFPWEDIFKLGASAAVSGFCEWVQVGIDVYIPNRKYQVKPHSSPWFSAACAAAIVHRNHFFVCTKRINLLILK